MPRRDSDGVRRRHLPLELGDRRTLQVRANGEGDDEREVIGGYGAVFFNEGDPGSEYWIWDDFVERIMPGAFDRALAEDDVRSFFNHDPNLILGRTSAETLRLRVDDVGLVYEVDPPAERADVVASVKRGDVTGSSFMFIPTASTWREQTNDDGKRIDIREIEEVELWEVGPVVFPAYDSSTSELRVSLADGRVDQTERDRWRQELRAGSRERRNRRIEIETRFRKLQLNQ